MKALKIIGAILLGLVGLVVLLYVIGVGVNWRDQPPSAAALEMKKILADRAPVADADNGFVYVLGFPCRRRIDPQIAGTLRKAWLESVQPRSELIDADPTKEDVNFNAAFTVLEGEGNLRRCPFCGMPRRFPGGRVAAAFGPRRSALGAISRAPAAAGVAEVVPSDVRVRSHVRRHPGGSTTSVH